MPHFFKRQERESLFKSFRKSMDARREWRRHRFKFMKGIKSFHHSPEGRKFHRRLDLYNALRQLVPKGGLWNRKKTDRVDPRSADMRRGEP